MQQRLWRLLLLLLLLAEERRLRIIRRPRACLLVSLPLILTALRRTITISTHPLHIIMRPHRIRSVPTLLLERVPVDARLGDRTSHRCREFGIFVGALAGVGESSRVALEGFGDLGEDQGQSEWLLLVNWLRNKQKEKAHFGSGGQDLAQDVLLFRRRLVRLLGQGRDRHLARQDRRKRVVAREVNVRRPTLTLRRCCRGRGGSRSLCSVRRLFGIGSGAGLGRLGCGPFEVRSEEILHLEEFGVDLLRVVILSSQVSSSQRTCERESEKGYRAKESTRARTWTTSFASRPVRTSRS